MSGQAAGSAPLTARRYRVQTRTPASLNTSSQTIGGLDADAGGYLQVMLCIPRRHRKATIVSDNAKVIDCMCSDVEGFYILAHYKDG